MAVGIASRVKSGDAPVSEADQDLHDQALERFRTVQSYESEWRIKAQSELNFLAGDHWDPVMKAERQGRPCLVFDKIGPSIDQVINDMRQSPPEARISPVGAGADKDTAEILEGILRNIDQDSSAEIAYMSAYEPAVQIGRAWWRILFEYEADDSFEQKIVVGRIANPFCVYPDPAADQFDYSDMRYCFVTEDIDKDVFEDLYPDAHAAGLADFSATGDKVRTEWFPNGAVRVAEYWYVETDLETVVLLDNRKVVAKNKVPDGMRQLGERQVEKRTVKMAKLTGMGIIEKVDWPGKWIPLVPVLGREIIKDGKRQLHGMVRMAQDANLQYDYMRSKEAEAIGLAPISQWLVAEGQLEGHQATWADANRKAFSYLEYKHIGDQNDPIPAPIRINAEPAVQAITQAIRAASDDTKAALSTFDPSLGAPAPEKSGVAINARQRQSDNAHFNYHDNLARAMKHDARIKLDLIPYVYSEPRVMNIVNPDQTVKQIKINQMFKEGAVQRIFKIGINHRPARYDVTIGTGPSYASRRQQGADQLMQLAQAMPQVMARGADILVRMLDIPQAQELADRLMPPGVAQSGDQDPVPPQVQAQMQQQQTMIQMMTQQLHKLSQIIETKQLDLESRERIASQNNATNIVVAELSAKSAEAQKLAALEFGSIKHRLDLLQANVGIQAESQQADQQQQHEQGMQQTDQQHQQDMATQQQQAQAQQGQPQGEQ